MYLRLAFIPSLVAIGIAWRRSWKTVFGAMVAAVFVFGLLRIGDFRPTSTYLQHFADTNFKTTLYGYIDSEPTQKGSSQEFVLRVRRIQAPDYTIPEVIDEKILVIADTYPQRVYGEKLSLEGSIKLPKSYDDFDYIAYLAKDQIFTIVFRPEMQIITPQLGFWESTRIKFFSGIFKLKSVFEEKVGLAVVEPQASFLNGILLGSRQNIPQDLKDDFAKVGVSHILAISGYNIAIIGEVISWVLIFFMRRKVAFWFSLLAIFIFTILTGASASVIRAALMGGLVLLANNSGRIYNSKNALTLVAFLMIFINPLILRYDIGFQLSFMATLGLLYISPIFKIFLKKIPDYFNLKEILAMTVSAQVAVLPLLLYYFHNFSLIAVLANVVVLPFIPAAMLLGFVTGVGGMIWSVLGTILGAPAWALTAFIIFLIRFFADIPGLSFQILLSWPGAVLMYTLLFGGLSYWSWRQRKKGFEFEEA